MITRALTLAAGLSGAAGFSQFPEFSQQYAQRLGGAVDELHQFVVDFDADAAQVGVTRDVALAQLAEGGAIGAARAETMQVTITRYERLSSARDALQDAGPFMRAYHSAKINDPEIVHAAWAEFKPAVPLSFEGAVFAVSGFFAAFIGSYAVLGCLRLLFRRRKAANRTA
ncbi:DUF2937 family protein [Cognatishimia sp. 1_MG-2023]|uniref:DUF2937 family protein n=1 Tax=Cognatishimia sp. 1_MG-2023 TaxID=3062642 RepID=UPI0026E35634|nr:DUF2937 family protein [Cognatishimia sp. 1_MG-2023]MDO6726732.1 DUF2937 family protein [Cognatishimia sp. 1_MG-2023]